MNDSMRAEIHRIIKYRRWKRSGPRGTVCCQECGERLDYQYGSIAWECSDKHLCGSCAGKAAAERVMQSIRQRGGFLRERG